MNTLLYVSTSVQKQWQFAYLLNLFAYILLCISSTNEHTMDTNLGIVEWAINIGGWVIYEMILYAIIYYFAIEKRGIKLIGFIACRQGLFSVIYLYVFFLPQTTFFDKEIISLTSNIFYNMTYIFLTITTIRLFIDNYKYHTSELHSSVGQDNQ